MAEVGVSGTRGEYGEFDVAKQSDAAEGKVVFVSPFAHKHKILLVRSKKYVVNGEVVDEPALWAEFDGFRLETDDEKMINLIRKTDDYVKGRVKELGVVKQEDVGARGAAIAAVLAADPVLQKEVVGRLKAGKSSAPEVEKTK